MADQGLDLSALGDALVSLRTQRGMTRRDLAESSGLSYPYVAELEKGRKNPSARALAGLAAALDVSPLQLQAYGEGAESVDPLTGSSWSSSSSAPERPVMALGMGVEDPPVGDDVAARITAAVVEQLVPVIQDTVKRAMREAGLGT